MFALKADLGFSAGASWRGRELFIGVALQRIEVTRTCQKASLWWSRGLRLRAIVVEDLGHAGLGYGKRRQACVLTEDVTWTNKVDMLYVCVYIFIYERERHWLKLSTHSCIQKVLQTKKNPGLFFPSFPAWGLKFRHFCFWIPTSLKTKLPEQTHRFPARTPPNLRRRLDTLPMLPRGHPRSEQRQEAEGEDD